MHGEFTSFTNQLSNFLLNSEESSKVTNLAQHPTGDAATFAHASWLARTHHSAATFAFFAHFEFLFFFFDPAVASVAGDSAVGLSATMAPNGRMITWRRACGKPEIASIPLNPCG